MINDNRYIIKDSVYRPNTDNHTILYYRGADNKVRYQVWLFLESDYLFYVDYVVYHLHKTFKRPNRKIRRDFSNENCSLKLWTWGVFDIEADVYLKTNEIIKVTHRLEYDKQLSDKPSNNFQIVSTIPNT